MRPAYAPQLTTKRTDPYPIRGIGAPPDVSAVGTTLQAGDSYLGGGEYDNAVQAYRAAGQAAVTLSKQYSLTMPAGFGTGQSGDLNAQLQAISDTNDGGAAATQASAQQAQALAYQINGAIVAAAGAQGAPGGGGTAPNAPGTNVDALYQAVLALQAYFQSNSPTTAAVSQVGGFQTAWNGSGAAALTVDQKYGPATQGAFQAALTAYGISFTAPQNAFSTTPVTPPPAPPLPNPTPGGGGQNTIIVWWESLPLWQQILLGGAAAGGTYVAGKAILKKHPVHKAAVRHGKQALGHLKKHSSHMARRLRPRRA